MTVSDPVGEYDTRFNWYAALGAGVWLIFLAPAVQAGWNARDTMAGWLGLCALGGFCVLYVWSFIWARPYRQDGVLWRAVQPRAVVILGDRCGREDHEAQAHDRRDPDRTTEPPPHALEEPAEDSCDRSRILGIHLALLSKRPTGCSIW